MINKISSSSSRKFQIFLCSRMLTHVSFRLSTLHYQLQLSYTLYAGTLKGKFNQSDEKVKNTQLADIER